MIARNAHLATVAIDPFYVMNGCRLYACPGDLKHPSVGGYAYSEQYAEDVTPILERGEAFRYCWLLDDHHLVIDVDMHAGGANGMEALERLSEQLGIDLLAECECVVQTPTGGLHLCYTKPEEMRVKSLRSIGGFDGIDTLARSIRNNALVIAVGSTHPEVEGRYQWYDRRGGQLRRAPDALLELLEDKSEVRGPVQPGDESQDKPGSEFMRSWRGVEWIASVLSEQGYTFNLTAEENGAPFYEYRRGGKTTGSRVSGYLGKVNTHGNYQWTNFSLADEYLGEQETVNILEGLRRILGGKKADVGEEIDWKATIGKVREWGFHGDPFGKLPSGNGVGVGLGAGAGEAGDSRLAKTVGEFWNYRLVDSGQVDSKGNPKMIKEGIEMPELLQPWIDAGWPKKCGGQLFVEQGDGVLILADAASLFAWIGMRQQVTWADGGNRASKSEFFAAMRDAVEEVDTIESTPHFPKVDGAYYLNPVAPAADDSELWRFVDHFLPSTQLDRQLIAAAIVTPFWGGPGGERPVFTITSTGAVGSGKSTLVKAIARLTGRGSGKTHQITRSKHFEDLPKTMGSSSSLDPSSTRMVTVDNFKGAALGAADIEAMITEESLSVWKLYAGEVTLPNRYCWYVTGNYVAMTPDLATRTVNVVLEPPKDTDDPTWKQTLLAWDLDAVIAAIGAFFQGAPVDVRGKTGTRFDLWNQEVLGRLPNYQELVHLIHTRSENLDVSSEEAEELEEWITTYKNEGNKKRDEHGHVLTTPVGPKIKASGFADWLNANGKPCPYGKGKWTSTSVGRFLKQNMSRIKGLKGHRTSTERWYTYDPPPMTVTETDVQSSS